MIALFIFGLVAGATITAIVMAVLSLRWFYNYSKSIIKKSAEKKVLIVNLNNIYDDLRQVKTVQAGTNQLLVDNENSSSIINNENLQEKSPVITETKKKTLLSELESMCNETPYVVAEYDEQSESIENYKAIKSESTENAFIKCMEENNGLILVGA